MIAKLLKAKKVKGSIYTLGKRPEWMKDLEFICGHISPEQCQQLHKHFHPGNRPSKPFHIENLLHALDSDQWVANPVPIIFDEKGKMLDGEHRIRAGSRSKTGLDVIIIMGAPRESIYAIDGGMTRTAFQQAHMLGVAVEEVHLQIARFMAASVPAAGGGRKFKSKQDWIAYTQKHIDDIKLVHEWFYEPVKVPGISKPVLAAVFVRAAATQNRSKLVEAARVLMTSHAKGEKDAVLIHLRDALMRSKEKSNVIRTAGQLYKYASHTLNKWLEETPHTAGSKLRPVTKEIFPLPDDRVMEAPVKLPTYQRKAVLNNVSEAEATAKAKKTKPKKKKALVEK